MATLLIPQCMDGFANWRFHSYGKTTTVIPVTTDTGETPPLLPGCVFSQESSSFTLGVNGDMELGGEEEQGGSVCKHPPRVQKASLFGSRGVCLRML